MVKANRTISLRKEAPHANPFKTEDDNLAKVVMRREDGRQMASMERCGAGAARRATPPLKKPAGASNGVGDYIGRELRGIYDDVVAQPVPDRFLALLNKLESGAISATGVADRRGEQD